MKLLKSWKASLPNELVVVAVSNVNKTTSNALTDEQLNELSKLYQQLRGQQEQDIYSAISTVLPQIIDSLTPQGEQTNKQEANADIQQVMNLVSGFLKR